MEEENELIDQEEVFDPESLLLSSEDETEEEEEELSELDELLNSDDFSFKASNPRETKEPLIALTRHNVEKAYETGKQYYKDLEIPTDVGIVTEPVNYRKTEEGVYYEPDNPENSEFFVQTEEAKAKIEEAIANPVYTDDYVISVGEFNLFKDLDREDFREIDIAATQENINLANSIYSPAIVESKELNELRVGDTPGFNVSEDEALDTTKYYRATEDVKKYIMDSIYQQMNDEQRFGPDSLRIEDFEGTWEEFVEMSARANEKIISNDPVIKTIFANAALNLRNESTRKYIDLLNESLENGNLDDPARLELVEKQFKQWQETRWKELLDESDYSERAQQYTFALKATLGDLYQRFARGQDEDLSKIDEQLRKGEIGETWWGLKDIALGMTRGFGKKYKQLSLIADRPFSQLGKQAQDRYKKIEELELDNLTLKQLDDLYNSNISDEYKEAIDGLYQSFPGLKDSTKVDQTIKELTGKNLEDISERQKEAFKTALSVLEDQRFESLLNDVDLDENGIADTIGQIIQQSNMLLTFAGEGIAQLGKGKGPVGMMVYGAGKLLSLLGTLDIATAEFTSQIFGTFDERIKQRKGENYTPTVEDLMTELDDPESVSIIQNLLTTGGIVGLERLGIAKALGATKIGSKNLASLLRGEFKQFIKGLPAFLYQREIAGLTEFFTEGTQGFISDASIRIGAGQNFLDAVSQAEFDQIGAEKGRQIGRFLPVVGKITQQSAIELNTAALKIADNFDLTKVSPTFANTERFFNEAIEKIKKDIADGNISEDVGQANIRQLSNIRNAGLKIPANIDGRSKRKLTRLLIEKKNLQDKIKEINDKDISSKDLIRLAEISIEIKGIVEKGDRKEKFNKQVGNITNIINNNPDANVKIIRSKDDKAVEKQLEKLREEGWKIAASKGLTTNYGTIFQKGDQQVIVLNNKEIMKDGAINTAAHEFLHAVLWNTVRNSKGTAIALGNDLVKYLNEIDPSLMKNSELANRVQQYKDDPNVSNEQQAEEVLTLFSEAVLDGAIELKADYVQDVLDFFNNLWQRFTGNDNIRFDSGRDVFKFIKDYNKSVQSGKFSKAQQKLLTERATGKLVKREYTTKEMRDRDSAVTKDSKKLTELTNEYKDGNFDNVEDLTVQYQKTGKDALKRWAASKGVTINLGNPQVDKEVTSLLNKEFDSFTRNFDSSKAEASTYMENIAKRIGPEIVKEATRKGKQVSQDVLTEKGVSPEVSVQPDIDQKQAPTGQRAKVFPNSVKVIADNITGETRSEQIAMLKNDIQEGILRVGTNPKAIAKYIVEKTKTKEYRKLLKDKLGAFGSQQYIDNVNKLFNNTNFIKSIPVANIKRRFGKLFGIKQIGTTPTIKITDGKRTDFKKQVFKIPAVSQAKLNKVKQYFLANEKRHQSLMSIIGEGIAVEAMQELRADTKFMNELQNRLDFKKSNLSAQNFMQEVEFNLDKRNLEDTSLDVVKANKKRQRSFQEVGLKTAARQTMRQLVGKNAVFNHTNIQDNQKSTRRTGTIIMLNGLGIDTQGSYNYGKEQSIYTSKEQLEQDVFNTPLTKEEIELLNKYDVPLTKPNKKGEVFFDKSKAKTAIELGIDEEITINGKKTTVLAASRKEQKEYKKLNPGQARRKLNNKEFIELQEAKLRVLKNIAKKIESDLAVDPALKNYWAAWVNQSNDNVIHPVRSLAPTEFFETRKGDKVAEHTLPASQVATMIMKMALDGKVDENFEFIEKDYFQGSILKRDDDKLKGEGYNYISDMPGLFFDIKNPTTWMRYVDRMVNNSKSGGINLNNILVRKNGKVMTLTESLGLPLTKKAFPGLIRYQNNLIYDVFRGAMTIEEAKARLEVAENTGIKAAENIQVQYNGKILAPGVLPTDATPEYSKQVQENSLETRVNSFKENKKRKGISVFDFDDTLAKTKEKVIVIMPNGKRKKISASQFAIQANNLKNAGAEFDFSQFDKVSKATAEGPLADLARKRQGKFGSGDIFVLTARPQASAESIKQFLDGIGINIPLENITGLEDGSPQAKVDWMLNKTAEGYNDFYFADDSLANVNSVKNILDAIDVKNKVFQAKASKKKNLDKDFNEILEYATGKERFKTYSNARARLEGAQKDSGLFKRFLRQFQITASAEDFLGLTYAFLGKGEQGSANMKWIYDNLYGLYSKAEQELLSARVSVANDFAALRSKFPSLKRQPFSIKSPLSMFTNPLLKPIGVGPYNKSQAVRVYLWNKQGMTIPGMSKTDVKRLVKAVESDPELNVFADELQLVNKTKTYPKPDANWLGGTIKDDVLRGIDTEFRSQLMAEFDANVKIIFSEKNLNKIQALFGTKFREALEDSLRRMKSGSNRPIYIGGGSRIVNEMLDYMNASVGVTMFINMRSGLLQLISNVNFVNWGDNNIYNAAKAFSNQKQYWKDVYYLMNSDYLVNRRDGLKINVNEAELVDAGRKGGIKGVLSYLLDKGFIITRTVDSLAIATGGATFYRNRVQTYVKQGMTQQEAETQAFRDFYDISEETQQSSNPAKISQQQASLAGRFILSFQNVTMQYNRVTKKAVLDLYNRRRRPGQTQREADLSNISKILYYTTMQNLLFNGLQNTLFAAMFEEEELEKSEIDSTVNGMLDSLLFGLGFGGAIVSTVKNVLMIVATESEKKSPDYEAAVWELANISPVLDIKVRKFRTAGRTFSWNKKEIARRGWSIDNPAYLAVAQLISATFNAPVDRILRKMMNIAQALDAEVQTWQRVALFLGWTGWNLDLPYWGRQSTVRREAEEDAKLEANYKKEFSRLKRKGYRRIPMTRGKPEGRYAIDYIEVKRPNGKIEYWLTPDNTD